MSDSYLDKEGKKLAKAAPIYLIVQAVILLMTYLDFPVYSDAYHSKHSLTVTGWLGAWLVLVLFGCSLGLILLIGKSWKIVFAVKERVNYAGCYLLGALAGFLALGLRFMPVIPAAYFYIVGGLALILLFAYWVWTRRQASLKEIFP